MQALKRANEVRFEMADLKKQIGRGEVDPGEFFDPAKFGNLSVAEVLTAQRRWGKTRARKFLGRHCPPNGRRNLENVKISDLTLRERRILTAAIVDERRPGRISNENNQGG